jgi:phenylpyruvate tautomerase PptA (4-oxalocrotonate tautomerase family)
MSQILFYGLSGPLGERRSALSDVVHSCVMEVLGLPPGKRAHRFVRLGSEDFIMPEGRSEAYTIIEIQMMSGRSVETRKRLVKLIFERINQVVGIAPLDIEITIIESPPENWGFRGFHGDEVALPYKIDV